jgi:hypothetical protein
MPKTIFVAPPLNTADIPISGAIVRILEYRIVKDQWTSIGTAKLALIMDVQYKNEKYSQMFSLDKAVLSGSIGRVLVTLGIDDTDAPDFEEKLKALTIRNWTVMKKGGKLYWYP